MSLSKRSVEMLVDLVEIKISYMDLSDREDARDLMVLEQCREELRGSPMALQDPRFPRQCLLAGSDVRALRPDRQPGAHARGGEPIELGCRKWQCAPMARFTSGGRFHPESCRLLW